MASLPYPRTPNITSYGLLGWCSACTVGAFQGVQQSLLHQQSKWCISARLVHFQGVQQSLLHQQVNGAVLRGWCTSRGCSSLCCTNKVNGAFLRGWCSFYSIGALETSAPPKKNPNRGEPPLGFSFICVFRYLLNKHLLRCAVAHLNNVDALLRSRELLAVERVVLLLISLA